MPFLERGGFACDGGGSSRIGVAGDGAGGVTGSAAGDVALVFSGSTGGFGLSTAAGVGAAAAGTGVGARIGAAVAAAATDAPAAGPTGWSSATGCATPQNGQCATASYSGALQPEQGSKDGSKSAPEKIKPAGVAWRRSRAAGIAARAPARPAGSARPRPAGPGARPWCPLRRFARPQASARVAA